MRTISQKRSLFGPLPPLHQWHLDGQFVAPATIGLASLLSGFLLGMVIVAVLCWPVIPG